MKQIKLIALLAATMAACVDGGGELPREGDIVQRAELCIEWGEVSCLRLTECGHVTDRGECETNTFDICCGIEGCGQQVQLRNDLAPCISAIDSMTCQQLGAGDGLPSSCDDIL